MLIKKLIILSMIVFFITGCNTFQSLHDIEQNSTRRQVENSKPEKEPPDNTNQDKNEAEQPIEEMSDKEFVETIIIAPGVEMGTTDIAMAIPRAITSRPERQREYFNEVT